ncbi:hypothetical protein LBMAG56_32990 [Verrucomicrobiota bacterium]|nr:hypothetical protein LBMAG56_32990 [Verrucomicrobiota bacterium]
MQPRAALRFALGWYAIAPFGAKPILSAGSAAVAKQVPSGTTEPPCYPSAVPAGTFRFPGHLPSTQVLGYFRPSLRDFTSSDSRKKLRRDYAVKATGARWSGVRMAGEAAADF